MAVAVEMTIPGGTLDQYDQALAKMGLRPGGSGAAGSLFHWVAETDGGLRIVDVWESLEQFQRFADEQIAPITQDVGMPGSSEIRTYEVHNYFTAGG